MVCKKCNNKFANRRQIAYVIDAVIWRFVGYGIGMAFGAFLINVTPGISQMQLYLSGLGLGYVLFLFFACKDGFGGKSPGKMVAGVHVVDESTLEPIGFTASFKRNLCLAIPFVVLVVLVQMSKGKRLGDRWANARVVWSKYASHPVFTGAELPLGDDEFLPGDGRQAKASENPFAAPN